MESDEAEYLAVSTADVKLVSDYTRLNFEEVLSLDVVTYRKLMRDAFIHKMSQTEEGRDYLEQAHMLTLTSPDREALREKFKGE